jgi:hypothetical protein
MFSKIPIIPLLILTISLFINNDVTHGLLQFWWVPLVACLAFLHFRIIDHSRLSIGTLSIYCAISTLLTVIFVFVFNHTATIFLIGAWISITTALVMFTKIHSTDINNEKPRQIFLTIGILISISLLLLPVGVNQVLIKIPSLSGKTHFSIHNSQDSYSVPSSHHYQKVLNYEEVKINLSDNYFPDDDVDAPLLKLRNDQDGVRFVIQDIQYRHTLGFFSKTLYRVGESKVRTLKTIVKDDTVEVSYPGKGGMLIEKLPIESSIWIALPKFSKESVKPSYYALIYIVRLIFWIFMLIVITTWCPKRDQKGISLNDNV